MRLTATRIAKLEEKVAHLREQENKVRLDNLPRDAQDGIMFIVRRYEDELKNMYLG